MEIMITHDHLDARGMRIVNQRADLRFIIEQFDIDNINQSTACGLAVERKIGFVAELGFATFFLLRKVNSSGSAFSAPRISASAAITGHL